MKFGNYFVDYTCTALYILYFFVHERSGKWKSVLMLFGFCCCVGLCLFDVWRNKMIWDGGGGYLFSSGGLCVLFSFCRWLYAGFICFWCVFCVFYSYIVGLSVGVVAVICQYTKLSVFPYMGDGINLGFSSLFFCLFQSVESLERV